MKTKLIFLSIFALLIAVSPAHAQDDAATTEATAEVVEEVVQDEAITAEDFDVSEPTLLPDSGFYFLKNWGRAIRSAATFNPVKKAELKLRFANEKLLEAEKLAEKTDDESVLAEAMENYEEEIAEVESRAESLTDGNNPDTNRFLDKLADYEMKRQKLMDRLAQKLPEQAKERVLEAQEKSMERFANVMTRLEEDPEKIRERIEEHLEEQEGSKFKHFKNLEVLLRIEEKLPEQAKEAIQRAQENALKRLHDDLSNMSPEDQERFKDYISNIGGNELRHAEIVERLKENEDLSEILREKLEESRDRAMERIEKRIEAIPDEDRREIYLKQLEEGDLPKLRVLNELRERLPEEHLEKLEEARERAREHVEERLEENGEIDEERRERIREELERTSARQILCTQEYEPVCGVNGKTYSNKCMARVAGVAVRYEGKCAINSSGAIEIKPTPVISDREDLEDMNEEDERDYSEFKRKCLDLNGVILMTFPPQCKLSDGRIIRP